MKLPLLKTKKAKITAIVVIVVFVMALGLIAAFLWERDSGYPSGDVFALLPRNADAFGIDDIRGFTLQAPEDFNLSEDAIRADLTIEPAFSYYLVGDGSDFILKPDQPLTAGATYTFTYQDGEEQYQFVYQVRKEASVVDCSLDEKSGIALDAALVFTFEGGAVINPEDEIIISPKVKGEWTISGDTVTFQPTKWQAGTYYQVTIASDAEVSGIDRTLSTGAAFSFETQDPAARIPTSNYFTADETDLTFAEGKEVRIPISFYQVGGAAAEAVAVDIWAFSDEDEYVEGFGELLSLPEWAPITRSARQVETKGLDKITSVETEIVSDDDGTYIAYTEELSPGAYLFRLTLNGQSVDIAVHVGTIDGTYFVAGDTLHVWCHQNGEALAGATVTWAGASYALDEKGYCALPIEAENEEDLGTYFTVSGAEESRAFFLRREDDDYTGEIFLDRSVYDLEDTIAVSGYVDGARTANLVGVGTLIVQNEGKEVSQQEVTLDDNQRFTAVLTASSLPCGAYDVFLSVEGETVSSASFAVAGAAGDVRYSVEQSSYTSLNGDEVEFTVKVRDSAGHPLSGVSVTCSDQSGEKQTTDENGEAVFYRRFTIASALPAQEKQVAFSIAATGQTAQVANAYVLIIREGSALALDYETDAENLCTINGNLTGYRISGGEAEIRSYEGQDVTVRIYQMAPGEEGTLLEEEKLVTDEEGAFSLTFAADPNLSYWVHGESSDDAAIKGEDSFFLGSDAGTDGGERLLFAAADDGLVAADDEEAVLLRLIYEDGVYDIQAEASETLSLQGMSAVSLAAGDPIEAELTAQGGDGIFVSAQLYAGVLPPTYESGRAYAEDAEGAFGFDPVLSASFLPGEDGVFALSLPTLDLSGRYFLRLCLSRAGAEAVAYYYPVEVAGNDRLFGSIAAAIQLDEEAILTLYTENDAAFGDAIEYQAVLTGPEGEETELKRQSNVGGTASLSLGILPQGDYTVAVSAWREGRKVAASAYDFTVYGGEAATYEINLDPSLEREEDEKILVASEDGEAVKALFALNLLPGDHLFQVMGQKSITDALGENTPAVLFRSDGDILAYQNDDGSFSRIYGGNGDLLLSALVAENDAVTYNKEALAAFIRGKTENSSDREALFLAYWGLSVFSEEKLSAMQAYSDESGLSAKEKLYLAQGLLNLGDTERAKSLYEKVKQEFIVKGEDAPVYNDNGDQGRFFDALLFADLGLALGEKNLEDFISDLLPIENETMTGRYVLTGCLLQIVNIEDIVAYDEESRTEAQSLISFTAVDLAAEERIELSYSLGDEPVTEAEVGDIVKVSLYWGGYFQENNLYLVCMIPDPEIKVISSADSSEERGRILLIEGDDNATIYIEALEAGSHLACDIVLFNLTKGALVGKCYGEGIMVK